MGSVKVYRKSWNYKDAVEPDATEENLAANIIITKEAKDLKEKLRKEKMKITFKEIDTEPCEEKNLPTDETGSKDGLFWPIAKE